MKADLIIKNSKVYNSYFKKFLKEDIIIKNGLFLHIGNNIYEHFALVTDDVMADKLNTGHLNELVKKVIKLDK